MADEAHGEAWSTEPRVGGTVSSPLSEMES